jgi:hypothetical protein
VVDLPPLIFRQAANGQVRPLCDVQKFQGMAALQIKAANQRFALRLTLSGFLLDSSKYQTSADSSKKPGNCLLLVKKLTMIYFSSQAGPLVQLQFCTLP